MNPPPQDEDAAKVENLVLPDVLQPASLQKNIGSRRKTMRTLICKTKTTTMEQDGGKHQNGWIHACSQRSVEEHLQETSIGDGGTHLVEFADAMRINIYLVFSHVTLL